MPVEPTDITLQLHQRLLELMEQVRQDQSALNLHQSGVISADTAAAGEGIYARLFDSLEATLHNLDRSPAAEKHLQ